MRPPGTRGGGAILGGLGLALMLGGCGEAVAGDEAATNQQEPGLHPGLASTLAEYPAPPDPTGMVIHLNGRDWQEVIDEAPAFSTIIGDGREVIIREGGTIRVTKPLRIQKFQGRLEDGLGRTPILHVESEGVVVDDFRLFGNHGTVEYAERAMLLLITAGHFIVSNGHVENATKHGIEVAAGRAGRDIEGGIIRDIIGHGVRRDVISINGSGELGHYNRNILVENITAYGSEERGAVEVVDGTDGVTVRNVRCDLCRYGVDVQDHQREGQINTHVLIDGVHVTRTASAIITANRALGHRHLTIRNISGEDWPEPEHRRGRTRGRVDVTNTDHVRIENVRIVGDEHGHAVSLYNVSGAVLRDIFVEDHRASLPAIDLQEVGGLLVDGVFYDGRPEGHPVLSFQRSHTGPDGGNVIRSVMGDVSAHEAIRIEDEKGSTTVSEVSVQGRRDEGSSGLVGSEEG